MGGDAGIEDAGAGPDVPGGNAPDLPRHLNPTDATLWDIERDPALRTTIVAGLLLDRPVESQRLHDTFDVACRLLPRLRQRVVGRPGGVGTPVWADDPDFDLDHHLTVVDTDRGADDTTVVRLAESMASSPFDRDRPLWECAYVGAEAGRSALLLKVHHSLTDGVGGVALLDALLDRERDAMPRDPASIPLSTPRDPGLLDIDELTTTARRAIGLPWRFAAGAGSVISKPISSTHAARREVRSAARLLGPSSAPLSPLMHERSADRRVGMVDADLHRLHRAAAAHGCTINHAFFAAVIGALAEYHTAHERPLDRLRVSMPVSLRKADDAAAGNRWAPVRFVVPTDVQDPTDRMLAMRDLTRTARSEPALAHSQSLAGLVQLLPSILSSAVVGGMMRGVDLTLTNVPGLAEPHYLAGAEVERIHAFAPTAGAALNVSLVSHVDTACIGLLSDAAAVTEADELRDLVEAQLDAVVHSAERRRPSSARNESSAGQGEADDSAPVASSPAEPAPPERLSALDTGFLRLESPETPMHIGGVITVAGSQLRDAEGRLRIDEIRQHVEARIRRLPRFLRKVSEVPLSLGRPLWVDDPDFDIRRHVRVAAVPRPGERQDLLDVAATLLEQPLDRAHPLWELWFVEGMADGTVAIVDKVHHALIDGISGIELGAVLFDVTPQGRPDTPRRGPTSAGPGPVRRAADAVVEQIADPVRFARATGGSILSSPHRLRDQTSSLVGTARGLLRPSTLARPAAFNREIGRRRVLVDVVLELDRIDRIRRPLDATVNDVVLAAVSGGLRRSLRSEERPLADLHVLVPVSTRRHGMIGEPGNRVGGVVVPLPVGEPDPVRRLDLIRTRMRRLKAEHDGEGAALLLDALDHLPAFAYGALVRLVADQPFVNLVVTNVPGSPEPLYFLGAEILEVVPVVPLGPRLGLGIAVLSYAGRLTVSLFADPDAYPAVDELVAAIADEFDTLEAAAKSADAEGAASTD